MEVIEVLNKIGYTNLRDFGKCYRTSPLYRASDNSTSLSIDKQTGQFYDFGARVGGSLYKLIKLTLQLPSIESAKEYAGSDFTIKYIPRHASELTEARKFDKAMLKRLTQKHDYWLERGVSKETIQLFNGGLAYNGRMTYRYVFPIINLKDELVGFAGRSLTDNPDYPKWKLLGDKSEWLYPAKYNRLEIVNKKEVIIVESIGDMLALWDCGIKNTLVSFGVELSTKTIEFLLKLDIDNIIISFNNDEDNNLIGNKAAVDAHIELCNYFDSDQIRICLPTSNDFGEMSKEEINLWKINCLQKTN